MIPQIKIFNLFDDSRIKPDGIGLEELVGISIADMNMTPEIIYLLGDLVLKTIGYCIGQNHHRDTQGNRQRGKHYHKTGKARTLAKAYLLSNIPNTFHRNKDAIC